MKIVQIKVNSKVQFLEHLLFCWQSSEYRKVLARVSFGFFVQWYVNFHVLFNAKAIILEGKKRSYLTSIIK